MHQERTVGRTRVDCITSLLAGGAIAVGVCLLLAALCAWLMVCGVLGEEWEGRILLAGPFLGSLVGGLYAILCIRARPLLTGLAVGGLSLLLWLLAGALIWDGASPAEGAAQAAAALLGGGLAGILAAAQKKKRK